MNKADENDLIYTADAAEFARACQSCTLTHQHKISQLERYLRSLPTDNVNLQSLDQWFEEKSLKDSSLYRMLASEMITQKFADERRRRCLMLISKKYQRNLVEQYEPLIVSSMRHPDKVFDRVRHKKETARRIMIGLSINGKRLNTNEGQDDDQCLSIFKAGLEAAGINDPDMIEFLQCYLSFGSKWAYEYHARMLRSIKVGIAVETKETLLEYNAENGVLVLHFVSSIRKFYRIKEAGAKPEEDQSSGNEVASVIAQSRVSYQLRRVKENSSHFFQTKPLLSEVELWGARLEVYEVNAKNTIVRDLSVYCSKKLRDGLLMDTNDEIIMRHLMKECLPIVKVAKIIEWLIAHKDAFRIVLAVRMNRQVLKALFRSPELLACLCADPSHLEYLQLLKFWYSHDESVVSNISFLLHRINLISSDLMRKQDKGIVSSFFRNDRENNEVFMFAALHTLLLKASHDISFLMTDSEVFKIFEKKEWIMPLALAFEEVACWIIDAGSIMKIKITPDQLCDLLKAHPKLWSRFQSQKDENIREMPNKLLYSTHLYALLLNNGSKQSVEAAALVVSKSSNLFYKLYSLKETYPNELLRFFAKYIKIFQYYWQGVYSECENYLLGACDGNAIRRYYEYLYGALDNVEFCALFNSLVLMNEPQIRSELARQIAKTVLISMLVKRMPRKKLDFSILWDSFSKIDKISRLINQEPRLALLVKLPSFRAMLANFPIRSVIRAFVDCVVENHSHPDFQDTALPLVAMGLLDVSELRELIFSASNRLFMIKFLITEPYSIELIKVAITENWVLEMNAIFQQASTQQLILLLMAFTARENELRALLKSYSSFPTSCGGAAVGMQELEFQQKEELDTLRRLKQIILESSNYVEGVISPDQSTAMDIACLISFCPDIVQIIASKKLSAQQSQLYKTAIEIIRPPDHKIFRVLRSDEGVNAIEFTARLDKLRQEKQYELFNKLLNSCILLAFNDNSILNGIKSTPNLLDMVVQHGELRLVAKMIILMGKCASFDAQFEPFLYRLTAHPRLLMHYRLLFNLKNDPFIPVAELLNDREESVTNSSSIDLAQLLDLIKQTYRGESQQDIRFERVSIILQAIPLLMQCYPESAEVIDEYLATHLNGETFDRAEVGEAVDFLVTKAGLEIVFPDAETELSSEESMLICQLFFLCNESQLHCFTLKDYATILIRYITRFNSDLKVYHQFVLPRIVMTLTFLFEKDPAFVEEQFLSNQLLVDLLKSSNRAVDDLLCSPLYDASETIRGIFDINLLVDQDLHDKSYSPRQGNVSPVRANVSRSHSSPGGSMRIRARRCIAVGGMASSEGDVDPHTSSSFQ